MINVAVIGAGRMGGVHIKNIYKKRINGASLVAIADIDDNALNKFKQFGIGLYNDYIVMLESEKIDAVIIATPHYSHEEIAVYCLNKNIHTLTEKPISVTTQAARNMIKAAEVSEALFAIMYNQRTNRMYAKARELVLSGKIGKITRANLIITDWYRSQAYYDMGGWRASYSGEGGGVLINQCVHQLDILQWIIGMPHSIYADMSTINRKINVENDVNAILYYDGYDCLFSASTHELHGTNRLEVVGEKGKIIVEKNKMIYKIHELSETEVNLKTSQGYGNTTTKKYRYGYGKIRFFEDAIYGQQLRLLKNFIKAIIKKEQLLSNGAEGINALTIINGIYMSSWLNKKIDLPLDENKYIRLLEEKIKLETVNK